MDTVLCDELLQEILQRLPPSSSSPVSLVSRRWLSAFRLSTTALVLRIPNLNHSPPTPSPSVHSILSHYPFLSTLAILPNHHHHYHRDDDGDGDDDDDVSSSSAADDILRSVAASACSRSLKQLRLLLGLPISPSTLVSSSSFLVGLTALQISSVRLPLSFRWLAGFPFLKSLSVIQVFTPKLSAFPSDREEEDEGDDAGGGEAGLPLEKLSLSGLRASDRGVSWLWRRCSNLRWLQLRACEGTGDGPSSPDFACSLHRLNALELRTSRTIADRVLIRAADHCHSLTSLLLYDGGSRDALRHFILRRGSALCTLDLRLPLDLDNDHLLAIAYSNTNTKASLGGNGLAALRLQSCCLITGDGLRSLAQAPSSMAIQELALVNCDVVEREPGLLTFLGQSLRNLRKLDLSHNELLADKEVGSMLASCRNLVDIKLRGCRWLTDAAMSSIIKWRGQQLEVVDISGCVGVGVQAVEMLILNAPQLKHIIVEESKMSAAAKAWARMKAIQTDGIHS